MVGPRWAPSLARRRRTLAADGGMDDEAAEALAPAGTGRTLSVVASPGPGVPRTGAVWRASGSG
ncbi:hypothetical protein [Actinocorallia populi]|uniref:hypothetical protein n=1 Tax=Actinocorallia populi TaxID=2079200 RepID=UPI0013009C29|nr:hypothetical protein [Actinocorallia populi]